MQKTGLKNPFKRTKKVAVVSLLLAGLTFNTGFAKEVDKDLTDNLPHLF